MYLPQLIWTSVLFLQTALERIRDTIKLDSLPWTETLAVTYDQVIDIDVDDDLTRELSLCVSLQTQSSI